MTEPVFAPEPETAEERAARLDSAPRRGLRIRFLAWLGKFALWLAFTIGALIAWGLYGTVGHVLFLVLAFVTALLVGAVWGLISLAREERDDG